jgi:methylamine dehydrogenase accessory protein MauD
MEGPWLISYVVLWVLVLGMSVVILAHSRLLGVLHHRFGPAGAKQLADGPDIGSSLTELEARRFDGSVWKRQSPAERDLLLVFVSPQCQGCDRLAPHVVDFAHNHSEVEVVLLSTLDDSGMNDAFVAYRKLSKQTYLNGIKLAEDLQVDGTPYGVWIDRHGIVRGKGLVNHYEHLLSGTQLATQDEAAEVNRAHTVGRANV